MKIKVKYKSIYQMEIDSIKKIEMILKEYSSMSAEQFMERLRKLTYESSCRVQDNK